MNTTPKNIITPSAETRPLAHPSATGNGAGRRFRRLWMAVLMALALATILLSTVCDSTGETEPLKLVPEGASLITKIGVADILDKVDLDSLVDALPDEEDVPQTIDEVFDLVITATGIDLSRHSPDRTTFPGYSSRRDAANYNLAFQGRQMRPDSLKFLLSWTNHRPAKRKISKPLVYDQVSSFGSPFALYDPVTVINPDAPKVD